MENPVLASTKAVVEQSRLVQVNKGSMGFLVQDLGDAWRPPIWAESFHLKNGTEEEKLNYLLVTDALNFCFWPDKEENRWRITYQKKTLSGYFALAIALRRALEEGRPITDFKYLKNISLEDLKEIFRGSGSLPLLGIRLDVLRYLAGKMLKNYGGQTSRLIASANGSAVALACKLAEELDIFYDVAEYSGKPVWFLKRAQIFAADVWGCLQGKGPGDFKDMDKLTAFADYRVPQVLEYYGVLEYEPELQKRIYAGEPILAGSPEEVEIRAASVWAVEELKFLLYATDHNLNSVQVDWILWNRSQELKQSKNFPNHHRTRTIFY